jgi:hypothetical protein
MFFLFLVFWFFRYFSLFSYNFAFSSTLVTARTHYAVAVLSGGMHMTNITSIIFKIVYNFHYAVAVLSGGDNEDGSISIRFHM